MKSHQTAGQLITDLFRSLTPKLGGGGITPDQMMWIREVARYHLTDTEKQICGMGDPIVGTMLHAVARRFSDDAAAMENYLAHRWREMSSEQKHEVALRLAGTRHLNDFLVHMDQLSESVRKVYKV